MKNYENWLNGELTEKEDKILNAEVSHKGHMSKEEYNMLSTLFPAQNVGIWQDEYDFELQLGVAFEEFFE